MKRLMNFDNIFIEQLFIVKTNGNAGRTDGSIKNHKTTGATVIDFKDKINKETDSENSIQSIDNYCISNFIVPALVKFKLESDDLGVLFGAKATLQKYQPQVLLECAEGIVSRETLLNAFKFLTDLNYAGYFILDELKIPLANFDFNIYQNEVLGFYCNNFVFE